jgi:hypothetical protein
MRHVIVALIVLTVAWPVLAGREEQILQQSDDTAEHSEHAYLGWAEWFEAPADCHIISASFYVGEYTETRDVGVWDNDESGTHDLPGTLLGSVSYTFNPGAGYEWSEYIDLTSLDLTMSSGEKFWVGIVNDDELSKPKLGVDLDAPYHGSASGNGFWRWNPTYDLMLRVKVNDDMDPPYVDEQDPAGGDTGVDPGTDIAFHCKDDDYGVDSATIEFSADDGTKAEISGTLYIDDTDPNDVICTFTPDSDLPEGAIITCVVDDSLADGLGNEMDDNEAWSFTVGYMNVEEASVGEIKATYR